MNKDKLIQEVRKYPFLYDPNDVKYNDTLRKEKAWKMISITMKQTESNCKKAWLNLRESHRRYIKKKNKNNSKRKWIYEDEMSFLLPHYKERRKLSIPLDNNDEDQDSDVNSISSNEDSQFLYTLQPEYSEPGSLLEPSTSNYTATTFFSKEDMSQPSKKRRIENRSVSESLMKFIIDQKIKEKRDEEIDRFFRSITATVQKFSEGNQAIIKNKIFQLVSETEIRELEDKKLLDASEEISNEIVVDNPEKTTRCRTCNAAIKGFMFLCVKCRVRVCSACNENEEHAQHLIRTPATSTESEIEQAITKVHETLMEAGCQLTCPHNEQNARRNETEIEITPVKTEVDGDPLGEDYDLSYQPPVSSQVVPELTNMKPDKSFIVEENKGEDDNSIAAMPQSSFAGADTQPGLSENHNT